MKTLPIKTRHGIIYSRDALIITEQKITIPPLTASITCSLSLGSCIPEVIGAPYESVEFIFTKIKSMCIYRLDDYPNEKYSSSSFDKVEGTEERYILSTYDFIFDITGKYEIIEHGQL